MSKICYPMFPYICYHISSLPNIYIYKKVEKNLENTIGLYWDYGLSILRKYNGHQNDKDREDLTKLFKVFQFANIKCNLEIVDYLHTMNTNI